MPSTALRHWQTDRLPRLAELDAQCAAALGLVPPNPRLADENLRGYVVLLDRGASPRHISQKLDTRFHDARLT